MSSRSGRRPGESGTRSAILEAARGAFAEVGYDRASIRDIARRAEVDPALVHHFFGTKQQLLTAAFDLEVDPSLVVTGIVTGDRGAAGLRVARTFFGVWDSQAGRNAILGLVRSAVSNPVAATMLREFLSQEILVPVTEGLAVGQPQRRAALVASQLVGIAFVRYVIELEPIASMPASDLADLIGPTLQRYLVEDLDLVEGLDGPPVTGTRRGRRRKGRTG